MTETDLMYKFDDGDVMWLTFVGTCGQTELEIATKQASRYYGDLFIKSNNWAFRPTDVLLPTNGGFGFPIHLSVQYTLHGWSESNSVGVCPLWHIVHYILQIFLKRMATISVASHVLTNDSRCSRRWGSSKKYIIQKLFLIWYSYWGPKD